MVVANPARPAYGSSPGSTLRGGPQPSSEVHDLGRTLVRAARQNGPGEICYLRDDGSEMRQSYRSLAESASRVLRGMRERGVRPGDKIIVHTTDGPGLLVGFWACVLGGFVPVPVGPSVSQGTLRGVGGLWCASDRVWLVTSAVDDGSARAGAEPTAGIGRLGTIEELSEAPPTDEYHPSDWDDLAVLLLTSGSTGVPKAVMLSHGNILSRCVAAVTTNQLTERMRSFNWMPLDHVGGLLMFHLRDVYLRCTQVHAPTSWVLEDPLRWLDAMSRHRSTMTWAPNFAFRLINDKAAGANSRDWDLSALSHIMNGGEAIKPQVLRRFLSVLAPVGLPSDAVHPGWGMSETSGGVVDSRFDPACVPEDARFLAIGEPHPGVAIRVVDVDGTRISDGTVGFLQVSGAPITGGYYNNSAHNRAGFSADGWYQTGDLGYVDDGRLVVTGRVDDLIALDGVEHYAHEIESAVDELAFVEPTYTVATAVAPAGDEAPELGVFFHPRDGVDGQEASAVIRELVRARFGISPGHVVPVDKTDIPRTGVGKLERARVRTRFETEWIRRLGAGDDPAPRAPEIGGGPWS